MVWRLIGHRYGTGQNVHEEDGKSSTASAKDTGLPTTEEVTGVDYLGQTLR